MDNNTEKKVKSLEEGPPLYIESLLSLTEYAECSRKYPNTYKHSRPRTLDKFKEGEFKCRYRMGLSPTQEEIESINYNLDYLRTKLNLNTIT